VNPQAERAARAEPERSQRACGECTLCCTLLRVDELRKLGGTPCVHLRRAPEAPGCGIHAERPGICRAYTCLWLSGALDEQDRPDRLGAVLDLVSEAQGVRLRVHEAEPGAYQRSPRLQAVVARYRASLPVRIGDAGRPLDPDAPVRELFPDGSERIVAGDHVTERPALGPERRRRLPWPLRVARRLRGRLRLLRLRGYR
jgi:Fe-S-cluster containining protein